MLWVDVLWLHGSLVLVEVQEVLSTLQERLDVRLESEVRVEALEHLLPRLLLQRVGRYPFLRGDHCVSPRVAHQKVYQTQPEAEESRAQRAALVHSF